MFRHRNGEVWVDPEEETSLYIKDSSFRIVKGLTGRGIYFSK